MRLCDCQFQIIPISSNLQIVSECMNIQSFSTWLMQSNQMIQRSHCDAKNEIKNVKRKSNISQTSWKRILIWQQNVSLNKWPTKTFCRISVNIFYITLYVTSPLFININKTQKLCVLNHRSIAKLLLPFSILFSSLFCINCENIYFFKLNIFFKLYC